MGVTTTLKGRRPRGGKSRKRAIEWRESIAVDMQKGPRIRDLGAISKAVNHSQQWEDYGRRLREKGLTGLSVNFHWSRIIDRTRK